VYWYGKIPMGAGLLLQLAVVVFLFGLISEQIAGPGAALEHLARRGPTGLASSSCPHGRVVRRPAGGSSSGRGRAYLHYRSAPRLAGLRRGDLPAWSPRFSVDAPARGLPPGVFFLMPALCVAPFVAFSPRPFAGNGGALTFPTWAASVHTLGRHVGGLAALGPS
jgi:hypothetical protein